MDSRFVRYELKRLREAIDLVSGPIIRVDVSSNLALTRALHANRTIRHPSTDTTARTITLPSDGAVDDWISFVTVFGSGALTIVPPGGGSLRLAGDATGASASRTLAPNGMAFALCVESNAWIIDGSGVS